MFSKVRKCREHGVKAVVVTAAATIVPAAVSLIEYLLYFKFLYMLWVIVIAVQQERHYYKFLVIHILL